MTKQIAVVTGASIGFGKEFVKLLVQEEGIDEVWAIARNQARLDALVEECGAKVRVFSADLSDIEQVKAFAPKLKDAQVSVRYLINNAGYAKFCPYDGLSIDDSINMMRLNMETVVAMGLVCLPHMQRGARIVNIASQASFQPLPHLNIYGATKTFVRFYSRALGVELKQAGITVTAVCPSWMDTAFFDRAKTGAAKAISNFSGMTTPDKVARKAFSDAKRGKALSVYGFNAKFTHVAGKLIPQSLIMKVWLIQQKMS